MDQERVQDVPGGNRRVLSAARSDAAAGRFGNRPNHAVTSASTTSVGQNSVVRFKLAADVSQVEILNRNVLFSASGEALFELNPSALRFAELLARGTAVEALVCELVAQGFPKEAAPQHVREILTDWSASGIIIAEIDTGAEPIASQTIQIAGECVRLRYHETSVADLIAPGFQHLESAMGPPTHAFDVTCSGGLAIINSSDSKSTVVPSAQAAPTTKAMLVDSLLRKTPHVAVHAACLATGNDCILLSGAPGAGKSTLAVSLEAHGWACGSDDVTLLNEAGRAHGIGFASTLKSGALPMFPNLNSRDLAQLHERGDGQQVRYVAPAAQPAMDWLSVRAIISLNRDTSTDAVLLPRDELETLRDLLSGGFTAAGSASLGNLDMFSKLLSRVESLELRYSGLEQAAALLSQRFLGH